jgi:hypothetical protein
MAKKKSPGAGGAAAEASKVNSDGPHTNGRQSQAQPQTLNGDLRHLPTALAPFVKLPNWVLWRWQLNNKGKWTKVPYQRGGAYARSTDPATWTSYTTLLDSLPQFDGIGFCLYGTDFASFDIDDCRDPTTGAVDPWAVDLVRGSAAMPKSLRVALACGSSATARVQKFIAVNSASPTLSPWKCIVAPAGTSRSPAIRTRTMSSST